MKRVFVIGGYTSKAHYRKYMKIARNLQKNYQVVTLLDQPVGQYVSEWEKWCTYCHKDITEVKNADYVVAYIPGHISYANVAFLAGYAVACGKPLFVVVSDQNNSIDVVCSATGTISYSKTFDTSKEVVLEDYFGTYQLGKSLI